MSNTTSDVKRAFIEDGPLKTHIGGQALIEGVMMRGLENWSVAVRRPNGEIYREERELSSAFKSKFSKLPIVRGCYALVDSFLLGYKALSIATDVSLEDESTVDGANEDMDAKPGSNNDKKQSVSNKIITVISSIIGLALGIALFAVLPGIAANFLVGPYEGAIFAWNLLDGVIKMAIFVFYIWIISLIPDIKRMFGYHGAEHKTIHCYEHGLELTVENARQFPRLHIRCGTAFMIMLMIISIFIYSLIPLELLVAAMHIDNPALSMTVLLILRVLVLPIIAGVSYEITVKWAGNRPNNPIVKIMLWPGLQMQRLTTNNPDDGQLECAIAAAKLVLEREKKLTT